MKQLKMVIFDFDGVIADTARDIAEAIKATQKEYNYKVMEDDEIIKYVGFGAKYLVDNTMEGAGRDELDWYKKYYNEHAVCYTNLYPGVRAFLEHVKSRKGIMCIVSNKPEELVKKILKILEVDSYFNRVIGPESVEKMKPHPEGLILCMESNGVKPSETIMVGDSYSDIQAGRAADTYTCGVLYGIGDLDKLIAEKADIYVNDLNEMLKEFEF